MALELLLEETEHAGTKEWVTSAKPVVPLVGHGGLVVVMIAWPQFAP